MIINDAFNNVADITLDATPNIGTETLNVGAMNVGYGDKSMKADDQGIWLGANYFVDAPFSVDMLGNLIASSAKIKGNISVGGTDNVNGVISVKDNSNVEKVVLDKDGVLIKSGKLSIQNDDNNVTLDAKGIRSTTNFVKTNNSNNTLNQELSSSADITNSSISFTLTRISLVAFFFHSSVRVGNSSGNYCNFQILLQLNDSGVEAIDYQFISDGDNRLQSASNFYFATLNAGNYTVKLRGSLSNTSGTPYVLVYRFRLSYLIFGT